jgi:probable rRNA maturation factor
MSIEVLNESGAEADEVALAALARHVLDGMRVHPLAELSMVLVDEPAMSKLNEKWMGEQGPTDVLAFPMDELRPGHHVPGDVEEDAEADPALLGDVVLCPQVAAAQARKAGHSTEAELHMLGTHGILHLLGYDHAEPEEHEEMFGLQARLLASWRAYRDGGPAEAVDTAEAVDSAEAADAGNAADPADGRGPNPPADADDQAEPDDPAGPDDGNAQGRRR